MHPKATGDLMEYQSIENYAAIGNMHSLALVGKEGSIDFLCFPDFDSPSVFAALLDAGQGGYFNIRPILQGENNKQFYLPNTNVLLTRFLSDEGIAEVTDFMPVVPDGGVDQIVRIVKAIHGEITFQMECFPRFDYARGSHTAEYVEACRAMLFHPNNAALPPMLLQSSVAMQLKSTGAVAEFKLKPGQLAFFVFGSPESGKEIQALNQDQIEQRLQSTVDYWRDWMKQSNYTGRWREMVDRSALMLKLLTSQKYGSLVAAPTFGLPEQIGGERNWDYRYTWLRDSSFSLYAFMRLGFENEALRFRVWLRERLNFHSQSGPLQVLYALDGRTQIPEAQLPNLRGYRDSKPVRIGNAAYKQLQLDVYGEMIDAIYLSVKYGDNISHKGWLALKNILLWLQDNWNQPDEGIWEVRGGRRNFLHSRLMCWVAFDRAIRLGTERSLEGPYDWMQKARDAIAEDIYSNFWNEKLGAFVQYQGGETLDAAALLMPLMRFISPTDNQWLSTLAAIERDLVVDTLVFRYRSDQSLDGLRGGEGSFTACSFWYIECLARAHRIDEARLLFEKMLGYANHVGLYSEELGPSGQHLGNFPQALTHLSLISAASYLDRALSDKGPKEWG
jgi:GH15 family glucan-1,4-alpha-glucosidase